MRTRLTICICALALAGLAIPANAQNNGGGFGNYGGRGGNNRGNGQQFNPSMMVQRQLDGIKAQLGMSDNDFTAIQPMLQTLMQEQMANRFRRAAMARPAGANNNGGQNAQNFRQTMANYNFGQPPTPLQAAITDLQNAINDTDSSPDLIEAKLAAVRAARQSQEQAMQAVENQLRAVLTLRQEALLTLTGLLQ